MAGLSGPGAGGAAREAGTWLEGSSGDWMRRAAGRFRAGRVRGRPGPAGKGYALGPEFLCRNCVSAPIRSIGIGKIVVELFSVAISASVCR